MTILVIDDEDSQRRTLRGFLSKLGYTVLEAASGEEGLAIAAGDEPIHLVISDVRMPGIDGFEVLRRLRAAHPELAVLIVTAFATYNQAVDAVKAGAWDYLPKPLDLDDLRVKVWKIESELGGGGEGVAAPSDGFIAHSPSMKGILAMLERAAASDATILLLGESGTGKSQLAKWLHRRSKRSDEVFSVVTCAALPDALIESELFGHEKGAFTGADKLRIGRFEAAEGGTVFLDEIGEVPLPTQVKLLHVLQERVIERLGASGKPRPVDVRIIAATNKDLLEHVSEGKFREDLYYRLNVVSVEVPPLRARRADISPLIDAFLTKYAQDDPPLLSDDARATLMGYGYPGNVRELENAIERAVILCQGGVIRPHDFPPLMARNIASATQSVTHVSVSDQALPDAVEQLERELIQKALHETDGVQTRAAQRLGITERNLRYKLQKYDIATSRTA
ncbi:MAG: sigma-54 dependent transcriptional regulator [Candidatus Poribacteria bacterium]|nr:sigma-54 dependent transcriptional regulator [Candidatus Poribacteria bacterium]